MDNGNIALGGILTECNEFSINLMTMDNFQRYEYFEGKKILSLNNGVVGGMLNIINDTSFNILPTVFASCSPGGIIEDKCYFEIKEKIIKEIKNAKDLIGVLLPLHGAAVTESVGDLEGDLISSVRNIVGKDIPIVVTLDLHAHVTEKMIKNSNAILAWEQYPHLDPYETGQRGANLLRDILEKNIKPKMYFSKTPLLHSAINASTFGDTPFADLMRNLKNEEKNNPKILSTSFIHVDPYIDQPDMGGGAIIITDDDLKTAEKISLDYSKQYWDRRVEFEPVLFTPKEAVLKGISIDKNILLIETADACGGGAVGDSIQSLRELINFAPNKKSLVHVVDPFAVQNCLNKPLGSKININLGHQVDTQWGKPLNLNIKVEKITDGRFTYNGGIWDNTIGEMGPSVLVSIDSIDIIISTYGTYEWNCEQFLSFDLNLDNYKFIVVKNPMNYKNSFSHIENIFVLDTLGPTPPTCKRLKFKKIKKYFPKDENLKFEEVLIKLHN